ncbi:MAG: stage II sporulation protein R [Eubacteriaceae bacterium]|nr:stage II sporulation protein R [Eubacteriaceae bacterium]
MKKVTAIIILILILISQNYDAPKGEYPMMGDYETLSENVIRLHILADGDDDISQEIKLGVRDMVLEEYSGRLDFSSKEAAQEHIEELTDEIRCRVQEYLSSRGVDYGCMVSLSESIFPDRTYEDIIFPAGKYTALKISLGSGEGRNWWCVMYPPLCFAKAYDDEDIPDDEVQVRWKIFEWWEEMWE